MSIPTVLLTGATALALLTGVTVGVANAQPRVPKGDKLQWAQFVDIIDNDSGVPVITWKDQVFPTTNACWKDARNQLASGARPLCPLADATQCGDPNTTSVGFRCLQELFGTPLQ